METILASADVLVDEAGLTDGLRLIHKTYQAGSRMGRHSHDEWRFCLALSGSYTDSWRRGYRTREARQLSLHPAGEVHTSVFHAPTTCFHIEFSRIVAPTPARRSWHLAGAAGIPGRSCPASCRAALR